MTINKRKKFSRMRGTHTHGWGAKKKHRGGGHRGGRGLSGTGKRADSKKPSIWKDPHYFGKFGFVRKNTPVIHAINLLYLENHIDMLVADKKAELKGGVYTIDLAKLGYDKLLSKGSLSKKIKISIDSATEQAVSKVKKAGGSVELLSSSNTGSDAEESDDDSAEESGDDSEDTESDAE